MDSHAEFRRRRSLFVLGLAACLGVWVVAMLAWRSGWMAPGTVLALSGLGGVGFLIWTFVGTKWVMRATAGSTDPAVSVEDARRRRRIYLIALLPASGFLWRRLQEIVASTPDSLGDAILTPVLLMGSAVAFWWLWAAAMWRFTRIIRAS
jgi:hypothetical protein